MNEFYYNMIFKRKSFHVLKGNLSLTQEDLTKIEQQITKLIPLVDDIKVAFRIVPNAETTCKRGKYCILFYSESKDQSLQNIGYLGAQLDLWLAAQNIGACWYGMGKAHELSYQGLNFVIMLTIEKSEVGSFRKDYTKAKRKSLDEIWSSQSYQEVASIARYAPSACNTQPWYIACEGKQLSLYRTKAKRGIMPRDKISYYNKIDIGIMMFFLETCLLHEGYSYNRKLFIDTTEVTDKTLNAIYLLK